VTAIQRATGITVAIAAALALAWVSTAPLSVSDSPDAQVRLSWGARPERIERCRTLSDEELAKLSPQMRQREECEGTTARYRLEVLRAGVTIASEEVRGGGLRHDRELYVFHEMPVPAGRAEFAVRFARIDSVPGSPTQAQAQAQAIAGTGDTVQAAITPERAKRETDERQRRRDAAVPPLLTLDTTVTLGAREVLLFTYNSDDRRLHVILRAP
jgi:hypothetical protein